MRSLELRTLAATAAFCGSAAFAQVVNIDQPVVNLADGPVSVAATFDLPIGRGPAQDTAAVSAALSTGLAFYTASYPVFGVFPLPSSLQHRGDRPFPGRKHNHHTNRAGAAEVYFPERR